ncbi:MAG: magnesium transporter CorA family protein [Saprospiraceae bacterium]|nr:magnesium transporter CorA family protein [Saprospiraceae bacterium]MBK6565853.1 magnesium transporter CorA family protein [Saprospiraceae bacterium]MBK6784589.1 magnesium transporter CorA family protein [Saprospiraceae bacterium]MBK7524933.1 magnesium transporter CorA family protein [Saprospiraceae bacterium]MBK8370136.1 magnesium transporter CorA family protein [Saprospiraceae bacterium]
MITYITVKDNEIIGLQEPTQCDWINVSPPFRHGELEFLAEYADIPMDFITDSLDVDERSRYERDEENTLILVNSPVLNDDSKENEAIYITIPIGIILTPKFFLTICSKENPVIEKFLQNKVKGFNPADKRLFVIQIFEQNVFRFLEYLKKLNLRRNLIEQELYNSSRNEELQQLLRVEKSLVYFVSSLSTNELLKMKMKRTDLLRISDHEDYLDMFEDIIIDNSQALEMSNVHTNILSGTMEAYASIVSNNLNVIIHRLTIVTIILLVPSMVASFYGMNLQYLPFNESKFAFIFIIITSIILGVFVVWYFSKKK